LSFSFVVVFVCIRWRDLRPRQAHFTRSLVFPTPFAPPHRAFHTPLPSPSPAPFAPSPVPSPNFSTPFTGTFGQRP